jgi:hypothetical protein
MAHYVRILVRISRPPGGDSWADGGRRSPPRCVSRWGVQPKTKNLNRQKSLMVLVTATSNDPLSRVATNVD